jgi:Lipocalin-like domain
MTANVLKPVGVWALVDSVEVDSNTSEISRPRGRHPTGMLVYSAGGRMCAIVTAEGRKSLEGANGATESNDYTERSAALFHSLNSYAGTYAVSGSTITHKVEVASNPAWIGTEQIRQFHCENDVLTVDATITLPGKAATKVRLTWKRIE